MTTSIDPASTAPEWQGIENHGHLCPNCGSDNLLFETEAVDRNAGYYCCDCGAEDYAKSFEWTPHAQALHDASAKRREHLIDEKSFVNALRTKALRELGLEDEPDRSMLVDDNGDLLWTNQHGSYIRRSINEHCDSTAFDVLSYLATMRL